MSIKTAVTISCSIICIFIIILSLVSNYWYEYEVPLDNGNNAEYNGDDFEVKEKLSFELQNHSVSYYRVGLWEECKTIIYNHLQDDEEALEEECDDYQVPETVSSYDTRKGVLVVFYIIAMLLTLIAFAFEMIYCVTGKYYFPVKRTALLFFLSALLLVLSLLIYTATFASLDVTFSWSYGAGWSAVVIYIITIILLFADK